MDDKKNTDQILEQIAHKEPDLIEFRLDELGSLATVEEIAKKKAYPAIATDRSNRPAATRERLLLGAASAGFEYVDVDLALPEAEAMIRKAKSIGSQVVVSFHDNSRTPPPDELTKLLDSQIRSGGDLCKLVTTALRPHDNLSILHFLEEKPVETRLVSFAMGRHGVPSRILSPLFGAEFTFASLAEGSETADGQLSIDNLRSVWQLLGVQ